jgi:chlorite dismutase
MADPPPEPTPQVVKFTFFQAEPAWRRLDPGARMEAREEFAAVLAKARDTVVVRPYSTVGTRGDADLLLWCLADRVEDVQDLHGALHGTVLGAHLRTTHSFLSLTRRSAYLKGHEHPGGHGQEMRLAPGGSPYLIVYPFWKTHAWYQLSFEERRTMMGEHFRIGHKYPRIRVHTTYSFGLDDPEFVLAFECDDLGEFLRMVEELRGAKQRPYTLRDTPILTGVRRSLPEALRLLG